MSKTLYNLIKCEPGEICTANYAVVGLNKEEQCLILNLWWM